MRQYLAALLLLPIVFGVLAYLHTCVVMLITVPLIGLITNSVFDVTTMFGFAKWIAGIQVVVTASAAFMFMPPIEGGVRYFSIAFAKAALIVNTTAILLFLLYLVRFHPHRYGDIVAALFVFGAYGLLGPMLRAALLTTEFKD